jgi:hypothetical protein
VSSVKRLNFYGTPSLIQLPAREASGTPRQRFGLERLVDLSRLLPADPALEGPVRLRLDLSAPVPELAAMARGAAAWSELSGEIVVAPATLDLITDIVSADAEQRSLLNDQHQRVPPGENALVRASLERDLVLQQVAIRFREAVIRVAAGRPIRLLAPWPGGHRWALGLSHDLDIVALWPLFSALRVTELVRHKSFGRALTALAAAIGWTARDPVTSGVRTLLAQEADTGNAPSTWFVLCGTPTLATFRAGDLTYRPESGRARQIFADLASAGHEIALHGSFETSRRTEAFAEQRTRLADLTGQLPVGVRQHFVRLRPGATHLAMAQAGFRYDATMGFSDRNGFRLGVADVVPCWNSAERMVTGPDLVPFAWMDRAMSKYSGIEDPARWIADGMLLANRCREVEGLWAGIWHPNLVTPLGYPGASASYGRMLMELRESNPWFATHQELVAWRQARRSATAVGIDASGRVTAHASPTGSFTPVLESPDGTRMEPVEPPR